MLQPQRLYIRTLNICLLPLLKPAGGGKFALALIGLFYFIALHAPTTSLGFDSFEHRYIANTAYDLVRKDADIKKQNIINQINKQFGFGIPPANPKPHADVQTKMLQQALQDIPFAFGDLAALAGDHAGDEHELCELAKAWSAPFDKHDRDDLCSGKERKLGTLATAWSNHFGSMGEVNRILTLRRQWYSACRELGKLQVVRNTDGVAPWSECFSRSTSLQSPFDWDDDAAHPKQSTAPTSGYKPSRLELAEMEKLSNYVALAARNRKHFPKHSWLAYLTAHGAAIHQALQFVRHQEDPVQKQKSLGDAVILESYAQHFLHDSFSSGHIGSEYGACGPFDKALQLLPFSPLPPFCSPTKRMLEHTHNVLNQIGIRVRLRSPISYENTSSSLTQFIGQKINWLALGDDYLFVQEAQFHRTVLLLIATNSITEVLSAAAGNVIVSLDKGTEAMDISEALCPNWIGLFPVPVDYKIDIKEDCKKLFSPKADDPVLDLVRSPPSSIFSTPFHYFLSDRSTDPRISDLSLEGWKLLATWGPAFGRMGKTETLGRETTDVNMLPAGTFELGYVRSTQYMPNYFGVGMLYVPGARTSIYPLSFGWWAGPANRFFWGGLRFNFGPRIQEAHTEENQGPGTGVYGEFNAVADLGVEIYPPFSVYIRTELVSLIVSGNEQGNPNRVTADSLFVNGHGVISFGLMFDLAQVF